MFMIDSPCLEMAAALEYKEKAGYFQQAFGVVFVCFFKYTISLNDAVPVRSPTVQYGSVV